MDLGELSHLLAWGATSAYAVALVAFAADLATLADHAAQRRRPAQERVGTFAGVSAGPGVVRPTTDRAAAGGADDARPLPRRAAAIAVSVTTVGLLLHTVSAVLRGLAAGRVPWANMYEFTLVGTLVAVATFLALVRRRDVRFLGTIVLGLTVVALGVALVGFYTPARGVEPALQSPWLVIHVSIATIATGLFTVAFAASTLQLLKDSREQGSSRLAGPRWRALEMLPSVRELEALSFRINAVAFVLWTFTIMAGAIWADHTWGRYWGWDPKEVWSFVVWVVFAAYLHARTTRGWGGRRAAWFVLVGYATVIFNFTVVNLLFQGLHAYSGVS
ncbi:c-type cytochrome biogenesis protein CcsB [Cellulomonas carbonis]|uniref:Cytochrome C biogenesis protein CcsB n=1 Tax=Cellulomonas carbonis T26 TaxID=947969 RepID=A0A0A0BV57_9CELL|nr:c-type cytochrome biogenesis protein CcsB [Cellulomonas carbonis]KGM11791.1 cytochrome C biogenesis protein CcsB [Cellulomonas carbonis T26]GGC09199.1 c-type cytochrome biogenesis protein CcsB [Cellulomonas carbonis]